MATKTKRSGQVRCLSCFTRFLPELDSEKETCPECGMEWRISWPFPGTAKVRGPVWDSVRDLDAPDKEAK